MKGKKRRHRAVFGIYPDSVALKKAMESLKSEGFRETDIAFLVPENTGSKEFAVRKSSKTPEGAISGYLLGSLLGMLSGFGIAAYLGESGYYAAILVLAGLGLFGAAGVLIGAIKGAMRPEYEARRHEGRLREGGILLSLHCDNEGWEKKAERTLRATGATGVSSEFEKKADYAESDKPVTRGREGVELRAEAFRRRKRFK